VLANMTEFGQTPLLDLDQLREIGVDMVLYPLTAFRAMSAAAQNVYTSLRQLGTQRDLVNQMQTRDELYNVLDYHRYEQQANQILNKAKGL
jgi:methylisocitrate lyase